MYIDIYKFMHVYNEISGSTKYIHYVINIYIPLNLSQNYGYLNILILYDNLLQSCECINTKRINNENIMVEARLNGIFLYDRIIYIFLSH